MELSVGWDGVSWFALDETRKETEMKVRFTGVADGAVTYQGKYEVTTGKVLDVSEGEANALLQTGAFEAVEDVKPETKKADDTRKTDTKDSKK